MAELLTPETFEFFVRYFLAGFVFMAVRSWFIAGERPKLNETLVESVILSLINQVIALLTLGWLAAAATSPSPTWYLLVQNVGQPVGLGVLVGWLSTRNFLPAGLRRLVMPTVRPVNPAFDFAFDQLEGPSYLIVRHHDGTELYGYFGAASIASIDSTRGGLLLEAVYGIDRDDGWYLEVPRRSVWIDMSRVSSVEFLSVEDVEDGEDDL